MKRLALALPVLLTACAHAQPTAAPRAAGAMSAQARAAEEIIVAVKPGRAPQALLQKLGAKTRDRIPGLDALVVATKDRAAALAALEADPNVRWAEPNGVVRLAPVTREVPVPRLTAGDDPMLKDQWGMAKIEAPAVWPTQAGARKVVVAIVDTGIYYKHPEFGDRVDPGFDVIHNDFDARDDMMHGTHCAGIVAAGLGDGQGVVGVAPNVSLLAVKVMDEEGMGTFADIAKGIVYAVQRGADVMNLSLGAQNTTYTLKEAITYATKSKTLVVAAMGNEATDSPAYPAAYPGVMAVGATRADDEKAGFSNTGGHISVAAPGHKILSTVLYGKYEAVSGTSMASPHVAGLAALLKSAHPDWTAAQIRARIEATADDLGAPGFDPAYGHGRLNARRALAAD